MKKIILGFFILIALLINGNIYAGSYKDINGNTWNTQEDMNASNEDINSENSLNGLGAKCSGNSELNKGKLCSPSYMIDTSKLGLAGDKIKTGTAKNTVENGLSIIVQKLMIAFGVLSLFIMTIGGGYMIFAGGQDELLNKGKSIFSAGLIALLAALGSAIIMKLVIYLLY